MSTLVLLPREVCRASVGFETTWCGKFIEPRRAYAMGDRFDCGACWRRERELTRDVEREVARLRRRLGPAPKRRSRR